MIHYADGSAHTDDATQTSGVVWTPQDNGAYIITVYAVARQSNGTGRAAFKQTALISSDAGVVTASAVGTQEKLTNAGASTWLLSPAIIDGQIVGRFTGAVGATVDVQMDIEGFQIGPF
jgi:hypothetical protein